MSTVRLECNGCQTPRQAQLEQTLAGLRDVLVDVGWAANAERDRDVCPTCLERGVKP